MQTETVTLASAWVDRQSYTQGHGSNWQYRVWACITGSLPHVDCTRGGVWSAVSQWARSLDLWSVAGGKPLDGLRYRKDGLR